MNYVVYADIMLVWIFFINYITYYIACRLLSHCISNIRLIVWCLLASIISELAYISTLHIHKAYHTVIYICLNILLMAIFLRFVVRADNIREIIRILSYQILGTVILSGLLQLCEERQLKLYLSIPVIIIICLFLPKIHIIFLGPGNIVSNIYPVTIYTDDGKYTTKGYMDTGNTLIDPYTNKPVIIIDYETAISIMTPGTKAHPIPFKTISSTYETMESFYIQGIKIGDSGIITNVIAAISPTPFNHSLEYKILLNINLK